MKSIILPSKCSNCLSDHKTRSEKNGEYYWECNNDRDCSPKLIELCDCFEFCNKLIYDLPAIIYNWAIYGNVGLFIKSKESNINLESNSVRLILESIRQVCQKTNENYIGKLGEDGKKVELFTFFCSNQFTLFALETETSKLKFKIIDAKNVCLIVSYLIEWFDPRVHIVAYEKKFEFLKKFSQYFEKVEIGKLDSATNKFLHQFMPLIVRHILHGCENEDLYSSLLNEIIWRNKFGETPYSSFLFIVSLIQNYKNSNNEIKSNRLNLVTGTEDGLQVDELYYGRFDQLNESYSPIYELRCNIRCHLCFVPFNFQTVFNHIYEHLCLNLKIKKTNECNHCFKKLPYYETQFHRDLVEGRYKKEGLMTSKTCCKICCTVYKKEKELIEHLKEFHIYQDYPYSCSLCPFRSSFYHELIQHFKRNHCDLIKACCKFCLKVFISDDSSELLYDHLKTHLVVKESFKCTNCSLSFISEQDFKSHFLKDHIIQSKNALNFSSIKNKSDSQLSLELKVDKNPTKIVQKRLKNGIQISVEEKRITKKDKFKLRCQELKYDALLNKYYIVIGGEPVICMECAQYMDTNHLSKREMKCSRCKYKSFCTTALDYPCGLHFSTVVGCLYPN